MRYQEPEFLPWDGVGVPMTFLAGYLGAGKTTLINAFLSRVDQPVAVLVNDVGEINIDARLIRRRSGDTIELTDGCVCCSIGQSFGAALDQIRSREQPPAHVVVELSGVSVPHRVLPWAKSAGFFLDGVVTAVDVDQFAERMQNPASASTITAQIADADLIVLTKTDLASSERTARSPAAIQALAPGVPVVDAGVDTVALLLQLGGRTRDLDVAPPTLFDAHHTSLQPLPQTTESEFLSLLDELPAAVVRAKGIGAGPCGTRFLLQRVGNRSSVSPLLESDLQDLTDLVVISL